ncbi:MAG TPA: translation initiation factor 2 [Lachnospiraceae bacterium]|nr:translation initiation factor 2 [Lachnospiraceae bacterium]
MRGSYHFRVKSKKVLFEFTLRRNITVIKGDSATGKTTLLHMLYEYLRTGRESGYSVSADGNYYVYLRKEVGRDWQDALYPLKDTVIFIEENNDFVFSKKFAEYVKDSGNYFVLINRAPLKMLPYSIHEIYEIITAGKNADVKESYHYLQELYSNFPLPENNRIDYVVTEDSNSGFQFFTKAFVYSTVVSAGGNSNILLHIQELKTGDILAIADGAAFGAIIEKCLAYSAIQNKQRISIWMPESFEYLILKSGLISAKGLDDILNSASDYIDAAEYESWEKYFTHLLTTLTAEKPCRYSKTTLNCYYIQDNNMKKILNEFPEALQPLQHWAI